jgi:UDP-GlcNAc:undecaprenyl-phosphate GlcNAc-1-phosphate transferase
MMSPLVLGAAAFIISVILTPVLRQISHRLDLLDVPNERSSHVHPTPRTGGYAIMSGFLVGAAAGGVFRDPGIRTIIAATIPLLIVAAIDGVRPLSSGLRFVIQVVIATGTVMLAGLAIRSIDVPFRGAVALGVLMSAVSVFWIVGVVNGFNFMDGLNGIASFEAIVCGGALFIFFARAGDTNAAILCAVLIGAVAGFVPWNFPHGSIFMGDVGSAPLGFLLATLALRAHADGVAIVAAALALFPFLFDSGVTLLRRALRGERFFLPHRTHFYQRLNQTGWSHARVSSLWGALAVVSAAAGLAYDRQTHAMRTAVVLGILALHVAVAVWITARESAKRKSGGELPH